MSRQYIRWEDISYIPHLPDNFVLKYRRRLHLDYVFQETQLKEETLDKLSKYLTTKEWHEVWDNQKVSEEFIERHIDNIDWERVSCCQQLSENFIKKYIDKLDWEGISFNQELSEQFVREYWDYIDKEVFFNLNEKISNNFIREMRSRYKKEVATIGGNSSVDTNIFQEFLDELNWDELSGATNLTEEQVMKWRDYLDWHDIVAFQPDLSIEFIKKFIRGIKAHNKWAYALEYRKFDEEFIEKFMSVSSHNKDQKLWYIIWHSQNKVSENFIRKHQGKITETAWKWLSYRNDLSSQFYIDFADKITWSRFPCSYLSEETIEKLTDYIDWKWLDCSNRSLEFIFKHWNKISKSDLWSNWEYVKYILEYKDE